MKKRALAIVLLLLMIWGCGGDNDNETSSTTGEMVALSLISPANGVVNQPVNVTFTWSAEKLLGGSYSFTLLIGKSRDNLSLKVENIRAETYTVKLTNSTTYFWKVLLLKDGKPVGESDTYSFTTGSPPLPVSLLSPENDGKVYSTSVLLQWNQTEDPDGDPVTYRVYLGYTEDELIYQGETTLTTYRVSSLTMDSTYYWKVVALDGLGNMNESPVWSFTFPGKPLPPEPIAPINRANYDKVHFSWQSSCEDCVYDLYLGNYPDMLTVVGSNIEDTQFDISLTAGYFYYWKVVSKNPLGLTSSSDIVSFVVDQPPEEPLLISPEDGSTGVTSPVFAWNCSDPDGDTLFYDLYLGESPDSLQLIAQGITTETYSSNFSLTPGVTYYWKIVANDGWGGISDSSIGYFYANLPPSRFHLHYPVEISNTTIIPLFEWEKSRDPEGSSVAYEFYLGNSCDAMKKITEVTTNSFYAGELSPNTTYCWEVVAVDDKGLEEESYPAVFTTGSGEVPSRRVSMAKFNTYYIDNYGRLYSAGKDNEGEVGNGVFGEPVISLYQITTSDGWKVVGGGSLHACAVDTTGDLYCWGWNGYGQLGVGDTGNRSTPTPVMNPGGMGWIYVDGGDQFTCGVDEDGAVYCWGNNNKYQVGQPDDSNFYTIPQRIYIAKKFTMVATGYLFACGFDVDHRIWCWGDNAHGQVPYPTPTSMPQEVTNADGTRWMMLAAGYDHVCAIDGNQQLWCWGANGSGQLGDGGRNDMVWAYSPIKVTSAGENVRWKYVGAGGYTTCGITTDGKMWCWGQGDWGMLGNGNNVSSPVPVEVFNPSGERWLQVSSGLYHTCGIRESGELWCWGLNYGEFIGDHYNTGMLAVGHREGLRLTPERVSDYAAYLKPARLIPAYRYFGAIDFSGSLYLWGFNMSLGSTESDIFLGTESASLGSPQRQDLPMKFRSIRASESVLCGISEEDFSVYCWGYNGYDGTLGDPSLVASEEPVKVDILGKFVKLYSGIRAFCALNEDGDLWCWGKIGDPPDNNSSEFVVTAPIEIPRVEGKWVSADIGNNHMCAIDDQKKLYCRGENYFGRLGIGSESEYEANPVTVDPDRQWKEVVALGSSTCAIDVDGNLFCWGANSNGVLGIGNSDYYYTVSSPVEVTSPATKWFTLRDNGISNVCGIDVNGVLYCWGDNEFGVIGNGTTENANSPVAIFDGNVQFIDAAVNERNACAIDRDYNLWCWGYNDEYYSNVYISVGDGSLFSFVPMRTRR